MHKLNPAIFSAIATSIAQPTPGYGSLGYDRHSKPGRPMTKKLSKSRKKDKQARKQRRVNRKKR